tara:strand:+ start:470 stop:1813 length:1344 start_codon:yes stop_codon:yes gene_type:complete
MKSKQEPKMTDKELRVIYDNSGWIRDRDLTDIPCDTITTGCANHIKVEMRKGPFKKRRKEVPKPSYRVPTMAEIVRIPFNGIKVASTFSGAGGSCTGYRMAGCRVVWANEFVPAAQESYRANASPNCILDGRDIREVQADDILKASKLERGELDIFDGSPPCQAFSTAGRREKGWGDKKKYEGGAEQKNEELFFEYVRLLDGIQPKAFIAENVSGLVKGTAKGFFLEILQRLKDCGYQVECRVLDAAWLGVPQHRRRAIFVGVRDDLNAVPVFPKPLAYQYTVRDALPWLSKVSMRNFSDKNIDLTNRPCSTIMTTDHDSGFHREPSEIIDDSHENIVKMRIPTGFHGEEWIDPDAKPYHTVGCSPSSGCGYKGNGGKAEFQNDSGKVTRRKFRIEELKRICAFPDDFVLTGTYAKQWERLGNSVPPVMMKAIASSVVGILNDKTKR